MQDNPGAPTGWAKPDLDRGYVVFNYSTLKNLSPAHVPAPDKAAKKASCALARDEYESVQFGVHALAEGIKDIQVTVESDIEVILYHRISPRVKEQLAAAPAEMDEILGWVPSEIHLQRGNMFEELAAGQSVNFLVKFHADSETKEGLHQGEIRIMPQGRPETLLDLEVEVRPFELQRPRVPFGVYFREDMLPKRFGGLATPQESVLAMYRDMAEYGHNSGWFYPTGSFWELPPGDSQAFDKLIPLAQRAGLLDPEVPSLSAAASPGASMRRS